MADKSEREKAQSYIAENRKAAHDYHLLETFEAGAGPLATPGKAGTAGGVNLRDSAARPAVVEELVFNVNIKRPSPSAGRSATRCSRPSPACATASDSSWGPRSMRSKTSSLRCLAYAMPSPSPPAPTPCSSR